MSDDIRIKKAVYESVKDMFALAVSGSRFKLKSTSYEVQNAKTKIDSGVVRLICQVAYDFVVKDDITTENMTVSIVEPDVTLYFDKPKNMNMEALTPSMIEIDDNKIMDIHSVAMAKCLAFLMDKRSNDLINLIT